MMLEMQTTRFLEELSSKEPVPGGGGASAAVGAMGAALGMMVANLTIGKEKYKEVEPLMMQSKEELLALRERLVRLVDEDAKAFMPLSKAYGLPRGTEEEKKERETIMEQALFTASETPLHIMESILQVMRQLEVMGKYGSRLAISDVGTGILFSQAALEAASLNVYINTKLMKDKEKAAILNQQADKLIAEGKGMQEDTYKEVLEKIR